MTVLRNILYGPHSTGVGRAVARERARTTAEKLNIVPLLDRMPDTLSGGEQQRVALARALAVTPELLLLDEPLCAVDMRMRRRLQRELMRIQRDTGTTFMHVTHDIDEAVVLGHRVGVMLDGRLHQIGAPAELFHKPSNCDVAGFLGMRNIFAVGLCADGYCKAEGVRIHVGGQAEPYRHIWIRPEEILLSHAPFESSARNQFRCVVRDWEFQDVLVNVKVTIEELSLSALVTYTSFEELAVNRGTRLYATFKSSAVHCF